MADVRSTAACLAVLRISIRPAFSAYERFELAAQLRRAAYSVAANIVEGFARRYRRDRLNFLNRSESSLAEVGYCIHAAGRLGYLSDEVVQEIENEIRAVSAPLVGLIRSTRAIMSTQIGAAFLGGALVTWFFR